MALLSTRDIQIGGSTFVSSSSELYELGTRGYTRDGRAFRYVRAGAAALVAGDVIQGPAPIAGHLTLTPHTTSGQYVGDSTLRLTCASSVAIGFYNEGYAVIASGAGQGLMYQIREQTAAVSTGATGTFKLYDDDGLAVAITTTSRITLIPNKYNGVIEAPVTTATGRIVGVAVYPIAITQYGWIQTWGPCTVFGGDTNTIGTAVDGISSTAGRVRAFSVVTVVPAATTSQTIAGTAGGQAIGYLMQTNVDGQYVIVDLTISP
jgi:hypothetical protein